MASASAYSNVVGPVAPAVLAEIVDVPSHGPPADHDDVVQFVPEALVVGAFLLVVFWRWATR